ncbi:MAG: aldehyde dehydrogenase family protein, partial [Pseudomonadota bacterium]
MVADPAQLHSSSETIARMHQAFDAQKRAFAANPYPDASTRREHLDSLRRMMVDHQDAWAEAISADFGNRSASETLAAEVLVTVEGVKHARARVARWMKPSRRSVGLLMASTSAKVVYQPKGVVGIIAPWNYPLFMVTGPLICALAAGNRAMIKPSEHTPRTSALMA